MARPEAPFAGAGRPATPGGAARPHPAAEHALGEGLVLLALVGWWTMARGLPEFVLPGPSAVALRLAALFTEPSFLIHTFATTWRVVASVVLALALGAGLALLARAVPALELVVHARILPVLSSFPSIGWAILAAIWFNVGDFAVIFVQVAILVPFCLINVSEGLRDLDREIVEMAHSFTRRGGRVLWRIVLPLLAPYLVAAMRIAYGIGWKISLVAELLGAQTGLGALMLRAQTSSDTTTVIAACFAIVLLYAAGEWLVLAPLQRRLKRG